MSGYEVASNMTIPSAKYLEDISMLFTEDAADWSESYSDVIRLLADSAPTDQIVNNFKALLCERFPSKAIEVQPVPPSSSPSSVNLNHSLRITKHKSVLGRYVYLCCVMASLTLKEATIGVEIPESSSSMAITPPHPG